MGWSRNAEFGLLIVLLVCLFWLRMELSTSVPSLNYDSYLTVRNVEHILQTGKPLSADALSVTGHTRVASPLFVYLLSALVLMAPIAYKILPNLFMVLLLIPVYSLTKRFTKSFAASIVAVVLAAAGPYVFSGYLNTPSPTPIAICLFLAVIAMLTDPGKYLYWIIGFTLLLTFLHPLVFILALSILAIILLLRLEGYGVDGRMNELFFFTLILALWFTILVYKRALFAEGIRVVWQNLPAQYASLQFANLTFIDTLYGLGVVTFLFGMFGLYHALFEARERESFALAGAIIAVVTAVLLRTVEVQLGLILLTLLLSVMAGHGVLVSARYVRRTKTPWAVYPLGVILVALFLFTAPLPALANAHLILQESPSAEDIAAYTALRTALPKDAVVLTTVEEGAAVQYFSGHTTLTDTDFLLVRNGDELLRDLYATYTAHFTTTIVSKSAKLGFTHILFSRDAAKRYEREHIMVEDPQCLNVRSLAGNGYLYTVLCRGEV